MVHGPTGSETRKDKVTSHLVGVLCSIPHVVAAFHGREGRLHRVWFVLEDDTWESCCRVYDVEDKILDRFPDRLFDFHVTRRGNGIPDDWVPTGMERLHIGENGN